MPLDPAQIVNLQKTGSASYPAGSLPFNFDPLAQGPSSYDPSMYGPQPPSQSTQKVDLGGLGGLGGSGSPDHFFDVNPLDQAAFNDKVANEQFSNNLNAAQFAWKQAQDQRDYALSLGDLQLAQQKQADSNYWQGKTLEAQQAMSAAGNASSEKIAAGNNAASVTGHQIDAAAAIQQAQIQSATQRAIADQNYQVGMAGATNDAERNRISLIHEQEYAAINKMQDDTQRAIASQQDQTAAFNAESTRAYQQGDLALKNNQFLLDASTNPRDLFGLYFMQRGISPDWQTMANGGTPAQGQALAPVNPMTAYTPQITLPQNFNLAPGSAYGSVGNASNTSVPNNQFIGAMPASQPAPQAPRQQSFLSGASGVNVPGTGFTGTMPIISQPPGGYGYQPSAPQTVLQPQSFPAGVSRAASGTGFTRARQMMVGDAMHRNPWAGGARPEIISNPTGAPIQVKNSMQTAADYGVMKPNQGNQPVLYGPSAPAIPQLPQMNPTMGFATPFKPPVNNPMSRGGMNNGGDFLPGGYQAINSGYQASAPQQFIPNQADFGMAQRPAPIANPYPASASSMFSINPDYGYSAPKQMPMDNWTGGMDTSQNTGQTTQNAFKGSDSWDWGAINQQQPSNREVSVARFATGTSGGSDQLVQLLLSLLAQQQQQQNPQGMPPQQGVAPQQMPQQGQPIQAGAPQAPPPPPDLIQSLMARNQQAQKMLGGGQPQVISNAQQQNPDHMDLQQAVANGRGYTTPRFALGTDVSQQYADAGLGGLYQNSSSNPQLQGQDLPPWLNILNNAGVPISPSLSAAATGGSLGPLNVASAVEQRGGGALPSLQSLGRMTTGETQNLQGYYQGPVGVPWQDIVDYIGQSTSGLGQAKQSVGGV